MARYAYTLTLDASEAEAIFWHGGRYLTSDLLSQAMRESDAEDGTWVVELTEADAWELAEAWEDEDHCLACGSAALNSKIDRFIATIV